VLENEREREDYTAVQEIQCMNVQPPQKGNKEKVGLDAKERMARNILRMAFIAA
jgi:hypothetical protein